MLDRLHIEDDLIDAEQLCQLHGVINGRYPRRCDTGGGEWLLPDPPDGKRYSPVARLPRG
jgi:hypothetical protein